MEESNQTEHSEVQDANQEKRVSFPGSHRAAPKRKWWKFVVILLILGLLGAGIWFILQEPKTTNTDEEDGSLEAFPTQIEEPTSAPQPTATEVNRSEIEVRVLNGTGIAGEAAFLEKELEKLGYTEIETGNASSQNQTDTTVSFSASVGEDVRKEITDALEDIYQNVEVSSKSPSGVDVEIVVGLKKGQSKPTAAPTRAQSTATPVPTGSSSSTPTTTLTPSPTP